MRVNVLRGITHRFQCLSHSDGQVAHALRTLPPVAARVLLPRAAPRLACVKPAASVHPEPGSNSSLYILFPSSLLEIDALDLLLFGTCFLYFLSVFSMNSVKNPAVLSSGTAKIRTFSKPPNFFARFFYKNRYNFSGRKLTLAESGSYALELLLAILAESSHVRILSL